MFLRRSLRYTGRALSKRRVLSSSPRSCNDQRLVDTAKALLARYKVPMPNQNLTEPEIARLLAYLKWVGSNPPPPGTDTTSARPLP